MARCQPGLQIINTQAASGNHFRQRAQRTLQALGVANTELSCREKLDQAAPLTHGQEHLRGAENTWHQKNSQAPRTIQQLWVEAWRHAERQAARMHIIDGLGASERCSTDLQIWAQRLNVSDKRTPSGMVNPCHFQMPKTGFMQRSNLTQQ